MARTLSGIVFVLLLSATASVAQESPAASPMARIQPASSTTVEAQADDTLTVPAETEASVQLLSGLHTQVSRVDDPVKAELIRPVYVNGRVALPQGSLLDGRVTQIRSAGRLGRAAEIGFRFETITLPDGQEQPIAAILTGLDDALAGKSRLDSEGHVRGPARSTWKRITGGLLALGAVSTAGVSVAGTAALAAILPVGGSAVLGYAVILPRGRDVHIPPDTRLRVRLHDDLTVRVHW
jgi:hypothetical protein